MVLYQIVCSLSIYNEKSIHPNFKLQFVKLFHVKHSEHLSMPVFCQCFASVLLLVELV